ncbi:VWA domain-containing protein [Xanthobacter sp. V3C-3]|uniref:VWA domain-containing protein n=1 Tax=Xanthobacter lutulentifluminis TaxID=3119935 RepID=UPI003727890B
MPASFHFLRPEWLLALVPALVLAALLVRALQQGATDWVRVVDPHLLAHLVAGGGQGRAPARWPVALLLAGWFAAVVAMAGPTWEKLPQPTAGQPDPVVVALSLSPSMDAADASPSRLSAARYKVADVLSRMRGGEVGLVVYADIPFTASPLTADGRVIALMLPDLATDLMRGGGNRPDLAIDKAVELLKGAGATSGRILLVTDGPGDDSGKAAAAAKAAAAQGYQVSVIGVGRPEPGPGGNPAAALGAVAAAGQGAFSPLTADDRDLERTLPAGGGGATTTAPVIETDGFRADVWADAGPLVLILALLLAPLAFRRGWIAVLALAAVSGVMAPRPAAAGWDDLWWRPDQQGTAAFAAQDYATAARTFEDPAWRSASLYRAGEYAAAADAYAGLPGADYNRGNALARSDRLEEAVAAYDSALRTDPNDADARFNRDLVQGIIDARKKKDEEKKKDDPGFGGGGGAGGGGGGQPQGGSGGPDQKKDAPPKPDNPKPDNAKSDAPKSDAPKPDAPKPDQQAGGGGAPPSPGAQPPAPLPPRRPPELANAPQQQPQPPAPQPQQQSQQQPQPDQSPPAQPRQQQAGAPSESDPAQRLPMPPPMPQGLPGQPPGGSDNPNVAFSPPPDARGETEQPQPPLSTRPPPPSAAETLSDDAQNREQALRQVLDDPGGLLRARIRAHYSGAPPRVGEEEPQ